jgi:hypothetical protein
MLVMKVEHMPKIATEICKIDFIWCLEHSGNHIKLSDGPFKVFHHVCFEISEI